LALPRAAQRDLIVSESARRIAEVVKSALELEPNEWSGFLDQTCRDDGRLRTEVESLLQFREAAGSFIEQPALHVAAEMMAGMQSLDTEQSIAGYRLLSKIGTGGMGDVYLAEDVELCRKVALKLVRPTMSTDDIVARFRHEEQILASLNHANIAQLYGGGATANGIPFFAMEYVEGERIDEYCRRASLSLNTRLELFRKVCSAVHYAHQHLVIHRDLKPSNILVTAAGEPKLLDFGIAKLLDTHHLPAPLAPTMVGVMTPDYASPEQVRGEAITTASDIYSLGVILYELLTECRPYQTKSRRPDEVARAVTEQEPLRPSTVDRSQRSEIRREKSLRGDLDNIILMALRKEPQRRYSSVAQFAEDIRRHLEGRPVIARKDTVGYRAAKFVQRNKIGVTAATLVALSLVGGIVATTRQADIATAERNRARKEAAKADRVTAFLQNVLGFSDPGWASSNPQRNRDATIAEALVEAARRAETELADEPEALAAVHFTIGTTYRVQSRFPEAEPHLRAALEIRRRVLGQRHSETAQSMVALGEWCVLSSRFPEAESLFREAIPIFRSAQDAKWLAIVLNDSGILKSTTGDHAAAEGLLQEGLEVSDELKGAERAPRAMIYSALGAARRDQGDLAQGAEFLQKAIEEHRALPGGQRSELAFALQNLGGIRLLRAEYDKAEPLLREAFELFRKTVGENHQSSAYPLTLLSELYYRLGDHQQAREEIEHALRIQQRALAPDHIDFTWSRITLAKILMRTGALPEAEIYLRSALEKLALSLPQDHTGAASAHGALGECLVLQTRYAEAEPLLLESHRVFQGRMGAADPRTESARDRLIKLYEAWGKPAEAARYRTADTHLGGRE